ncbi:MAG: GTP-binding protein [Reinekea forsetii]|nr:GTP-binding protein [Reinekea forsetii]
MLKQIPTHLITGFLGAGKTTLLQHWLAQKPAHERWAILVNEFGAIGLDAALLSGATEQSDTKTDDVFIQEVAGGCLCCAAGVPLTVALNRLLKRAQPDRFFIEPTGLGHPKAVLAVLTGPLYQGVLDVQQTVTLVDARLIKDSRYSEHPTFRQQLAIADRVVASKADQYQGTEFADLTAFLSANFPKLAAPMRSSAEQPVSLAQLLADGTDAPVVAHSAPALTIAQPRINLPLGPAPGDWVCLQNSSAGHYSIGWQFLPTDRFDPSALIALIDEVRPIRVKAWINTAAGSLQINRTLGAETETETETETESEAPAQSVNRLELIHDRAFDAAALTTRLRACLLS